MKEKFSDTKATSLLQVYMVSGDKESSALSTTMDLTDFDNNRSGATSEIIK